MALRIRALCTYATLVAVCTSCRHAPPPAKAPSAVDEEVLKSASSALFTPSKPYPSTKKERVTDHYPSLGIDVPDDYRWLETPSPELTSWVDAENAYTRSVLDKVPGRARLRSRVEALLAEGGARYSSFSSSAGRIFALKAAPPKQHPLLVVLSTKLDPGSEQVVVDPNLLDPSGNTGIDWFVPSHSGKLVAISLSKGGSENGDLHVLDVATGKEQTADTIPHVQGGTAGGSAAWTADDKGLFYTRYPHEGERAAADMEVYQQVWFHKLGAPVATDVYSIGKEFPRVAEIELAGSESGSLLARVANGDGGDYEHWFSDGKRWTKLADYADQIRLAKFSPSGDVYLLHGDAQITLVPKKLLAKALGKGERALSARAKAFPTKAKGYVSELLPTAKRLVLVVIDGGPTHVLSGDDVVETLPISVTNGLTSAGGDDFFFRNESFLEPPAWYAYRAEAKSVAKTPLAEHGAANFDDSEVAQTTCHSKDGTSVPLSILRKKGTVLDGSNPTWLTGYGGFGIDFNPNYMPIMRLWLDAGGVLAWANLRGGDEFGEAWHEQGKQTKKQNVFDDFTACVEQLFQEKYTNHRALVIHGRSNGGLLMGAELTQHPEMFGAVVSGVGIYDSLRYEQTPNGAFNVPEYGSMKDAEQAKAIYAYSPYHHVSERVAYPPTLLTTGSNDSRVLPWNSWKMAARLQDATEETPMILLRTSAKSGHGANGGSPLSERIDEWTDIFAFTFKALGIPYTP